MKKESNVICEVKSYWLADVKQAFYTKEDQLQDESNRKKYYTASLDINKFIEHVVCSLAVVNEYGFGKYSNDVFYDDINFEISVEIDGDIWGGNKRYKISVTEITKIFGERAIRRVFHYYQGFINNFIAPSRTVKCDVIELKGDYQLFLGVVNQCDEIVKLSVRKQCNKFYFIKRFVDMNIIVLLPKSIELSKNDSA